jgi:quercetin dioxygenase-like cupin family protein
MAGSKVSITARQARPGRQSGMVNSSGSHHPFGQILHVTEGEGLVQRRGGGRETIRAGHTVQAEAGEWHWHGAGPGTFVNHLAVQEADADGQTTYWGEQVTDDEYRG